MDDWTDNSEARIRALGQLRLPTRVHDETEALTLRFEDPAVRSAAERSPRRWGRVGVFSRGRRVLAGGLIALAGMGVAVPAAAAFTSWLARTGEFGDPSTSTEVDDTEWIDLGAPDAPQVVIEAYPDYLTLPEDVPREAAIADVSRIFEKLGLDAGGQALGQEGLMTQTYETFAICAWTGDWLNAHEASDAAREDRAASWLGDTDNFPSMVAHDGGGVTDALLGFAAAARDGEVKTVQQAFDMQSCDERLRGGKP